VGAGDIAVCGSSPGAAQTATLLDQIFAGNPAGGVFTAGDNAYVDGTLSEYTNCYGPYWGKHKSRTRPAPGNHEYHSNSDSNGNGANDYFDYFGAAAGPPDKGYYSYELGKWHIIVLNSNLDTGAGGAQDNWLKADLAAHPNACTAAMWHHPRYSSGSQHGSSSWMQYLYKTLYDGNADLAIVGHDHQYERFAPQDAFGNLDNVKGIREFLVGTGGGGLYSFATPIANSEVRYNASYGVIKYTLHANSYDWQFIAVGGAIIDQGSQSCH
jgi:hypothetical protein